MRARSGDGPARAQASRGPPVISICLYCGSSPGREPAHAATAEAFGRGIAAAGWRLVYGAGDHGLMGIAARAAEAGGAPVLGFIPRHLVAREVAKADLAHLVVTETMHERKAMMLSNSDAAVALPGGPGTLDELVEVLTWRHLGLHEKPMVLVNGQGYWDPLLNLFRHMEEQGFVGPHFREALSVASDAAEALAILSERLGPRG